MASLSNYRRNPPSNAPPFPPPFIAYDEPTDSGDDDDDMRAIFGSSDSDAEEGELPSLADRGATHPGANRIPVPRGHPASPLPLFGENVVISDGERGAMDVDSSHHDDEDTVMADPAPLPIPAPRARARSVTFAGPSSEAPCKRRRLNDSDDSERDSDNDGWRRHSPARWRGGSRRSRPKVCLSLQFISPHSSLILTLTVPVHSARHPSRRFIGQRQHGRARYRRHASNRCHCRGDGCMRARCAQRRPLRA